MTTLCMFEDSVHEAVRSKVWPTGIATHVESCPYCASIVRLHAKLHRARDAQNSNVPTSNTVWVLAEWEKRRHEQRKLRRRITWTSVAGLGAIVVFGWITGQIFGLGWPVALAWNQTLVPLIGVIALWMITKTQPDRRYVLESKV